jgi:hypothetical protein
MSFVPRAIAKEEKAAKKKGPRYKFRNLNLYHKSTFRSVLWEIGVVVIRAKTVVEKAVQCTNAQIVKL